MQTHPLDFPALEGRPVTQAHTDRCAKLGHATHTVDGASTGTCPRCGEVTEPANRKVGSQLTYHVHEFALVRRDAAYRVLGEGRFGVVAVLDRKHPNCAARTHDRRVELCAHEHEVANLVKYYAHYDQYLLVHPMRIED